jgi:hypothetical protein
LSGYYAGLGLNAHAGNGFYAFIAPKKHLREGQITPLARKRSMSSAVRPSRSFTVMAGGGRPSTDFSPDLDNSGVRLPMPGSGKVIPIEMVVPHRP